MSIFGSLIEVNNQKKELEDLILKKKAEFEQLIIKETEQLKELIERDRILREEVILILEKNNETNVTLENVSISKQVRKTLKVDDPSVLLASISAHSDSLKELGIDIKEAQKAFKHDIIVKDKKMIMDIIEKYENVEGKLLDGVIEQKTSFITIKNNN
jgi:hypothetical protein